MSTMNTEIGRQPPLTRRQFSKITVGAFAVLSVPSAVAARIQTGGSTTTPAWLLFLDQSGQDRTHSPYDVLAGLAVDRDRLPALATALAREQEQHFGLPLSDAYGKEARAQQLLKPKVFRHAHQAEPIAEPLRTQLARQALTDGTAVSGPQLTALGQAKLAYVERALAVCQHYGTQAFASIIAIDGEGSHLDYRHRDAASLFHGFSDLVGNKADGPLGIVVFDQKDQFQQQIVSEQLAGGNSGADAWRDGSPSAIPEFMSVTPDLTPVVQMADLVAYVVSWSVRVDGMDKPPRGDLEDFARSVSNLEYRPDTSMGCRRGFELGQTGQSTAISDCATLS